MNKKAGLVGTILLIVMALILIFGIFVFYQNFHMTCVANNLKTIALNMSNCVR